MENDIIAIFVIVVVAWFLQWVNSFNPVPIVNQVLNIVIVGVALFLVLTKLINIIHGVI